MKNKQKRLKFLIFFPAFILWTSTNLFFLWIRLAGISYSIVLIIKSIAFLFFITSLIILLVRIFRFDEWRTLSNYVVLGVGFLFLTGINTSYLNIVEDKFLDSIEYQACYEDGMNTSRIVFRKDGIFEFYNIGFLAYVHYSKGYWIYRSDTLELQHSKGQQRVLGTKLMFKNDEIYKFQADSLIPTGYYLEQCKGMN